MKQHPTAGGDTQEQLRKLEKLARLLDSKYRIPGTNIRYGLDGILSILPGIGDTAALLPALYIFFQGYSFGLSKRKLGQMGFNLAVDYLVGSIPVLGTIFDVAYKANNKNMDIIRKHLNRRLADGAIDVETERMSA